MDFWATQSRPTTSPIMQMVIGVGRCDVTTALGVNVNRVKVGEDGF